MNRLAPVIAGTLAALVLLLAAYLGSYYALVERLGVSNLGVFWYVPAYPWDSAALDAFFWPAYQLDLLLRPNYWASPPHSPVGYGWTRETHASPPL